MKYWLVRKTAAPNAALPPTGVLDRRGWLPIENGEADEVIVAIALQWVPVGRNNTNLKSCGRVYRAVAMKSKNFSLT